MDLVVSRVTATETEWLLRGTGTEMLAHGENLDEPATIDLRKVFEARAERRLSWERG